MKPTKTISAGRFRIMRLPAVDNMQSIAPDMLSHIPSGATIIRNDYDIRTDEVVLVIEHSSFDEVERGQPIPPLDAHNQIV